MTASTRSNDLDVVGGRLGAWRLVLAASMLLAAHHVAQAAETIRVVTEELPPYNMLRDGRVTGLATDVVTAVMQQVGITSPIELMPWARAYETALTDRNVLLYSMSRTPEREKLFKWVGEVGPTEQYYFYALSTRHLRLKDLGAARAYRIATINGDVGEKLLLANGFAIGTNLSRSTKFTSSYQKLKVGHVDLWLAGELTAAYTARSVGDDPNVVLDRLLLLPNVGAGDRAVMAFGPHTPDALVEKFREGLRAIHENGTFDAIQRKWR